jgi:hypothetical protein
MSASSTKQPSFDIHAFDLEMISWVKAGLTTKQIIEKAQAEWPAVDQHFVEATLAITRKVLADQPRRQVLDPYRDACQGHIRRKKFLRKLEAKIEAMDEVPVSLLSLYRGVLRDFEASSYKLLAFEQTHQQKPAPKFDLEKFKEQLSQLQEPEEDDEELEKAPPVRQGNGILKKVMLSSLVFIALALLLRTGLSRTMLSQPSLATASTASTSPLLVVEGIEPVVECLQTDSQLVGSCGLVPLMLVQHRKDMLHLDVFQRTVAANSPGNRGCSTVRLHRYRT